MSQPIQIDYTLISYMVIAIFGLVGFMRGWWKEAITSGLLALLLVLLKKPETAAKLVDYIDKIVVFVWGAMQNVRTSSDMMAAALPTEEAPVVDPKRYSIYVIILVAAIVASYFFSKIGLTQTMSAGARIIGAGLGIYNGTVVLTLMREFVIGRFLPGASEMSAAAVAPASVSLEVTSLPQTSYADAPVVYFLIAGGILVFVVAIFSSVRLGRQQPPLYSRGKDKRGNGGED
jgi:hypothetical protein